MAHVKLKTRKRIANKAKGIRKLKSRSCVAGRVRTTGTGLLRVTHACKSHNMIKHSSGQRKRQRGTSIAKSAVIRVIKRFWRLNIRGIKS